MFMTVMQLSCIVITMKVGFLCKEQRLVEQQSCIGLMVSMQLAPADNSPHGCCQASLSVIIYCTEVIQSSLQWEARHHHAIMRLLNVHAMMHMTYTMHMQSQACLG